LGILYVNRSQLTKLSDEKNITKGLLTSEENKKEFINNSGDGIVKKNIIVMPTIDYNALKKDDELIKLMNSRKTEFGIKNSLDMIVKSNESFTIGDNHISMRDILEKAFIKQGNVFEEKIATSGAVSPQKIKTYGIYVVRPGDNIWNIHFNILKEFYEHKGINVSPKADEPVDQGMSSGVGKILKFSETMVIIYNLVDKKVVSDTNLLEPLSKIIIYNMDEVFSLLFEFNYYNIDRIQFDGKTIWIPAKKL
jgi:hypothetical protein